MDYFVTKHMHENTHTCITLKIYTRGLWKRITIILHFFLQTVYAIEKSLAGFNVEPRIGRR